MQSLKTEIAKLTESITDMGLVGEFPVPMPHASTSTVQDGGLCISSHRRNSNVAQLPF